MYFHERVTEARPIVAYPTPEQADRAINAVEKFISEIYLPFRGGGANYKTERAILPEAPNVPHRENDAEHSWHIEKTVQLLYDNHEEFGLYFPRNFDIQKARRYATTHDIIEVISGDVDAMTQDIDLLESKAARERAAMCYIRENMPHLVGILSEWEEYEAKDNPESQFVSDVDKIAATMVIFVDKGRRWHDWEGQQTTREFMCREHRRKILTQNGHALYDAIERKLDEHPEYFPASTRTMPEIVLPSRLFDVAPYTQ